MATVSVLRELKEDFWEGGSSAFSVMKFWYLSFMAFKSYFNSFYQSIYCIFTFSLIFI